MQRGRVWRVPGCGGATSVLTAHHAEFRLLLEAADARVREPPDFRQLVQIELIGAKRGQREQPRVQLRTFVSYLRDRTLPILARPVVRNLW